MIGIDGAVVVVWEGEVACVSVLLMLLLLMAVAAPLMLPPFVVMFVCAFTRFFRPVYGACACV